MVGNEYNAEFFANNPLRKRQTHDFRDRGMVRNPAPRLQPFAD